MDYVEHVLERPDGTQQKVTIQAPAQIGLPTPIEEDVLLGLIFLAKENNFESDTVYFVPAQLLEIIRWPRKGDSYDRLSLSLKRLRAVTVTYELTWFSKLAAQVQPELTTGILGEAELVRRRKSGHATADSYVQFTKSFFGSLEEGNLTDLDLDLYFSLKRPGSKQLFRHLNKVWFAGRKPRIYGRDIRQLAVGHLGMKDTKDLKRNFDRFVKELESVGYLRRSDARYSKVKKGVWRAEFELNPDFARTRQTASPTKTAPKITPANALVTRYHELRFNDGRAVRKHERERAEELLTQHDAEAIHPVLKKAAEQTEKTFRGEDKYFGSAVETIVELIEDRKKRAEDDRRKKIVVVENAKKSALERSQKQQRLQAKKELQHRYEVLSKAKKEALFDQAIQAADSEFMRDRLKRAKHSGAPTSDMLALLS